MMSGRVTSAMTRNLPPRTRESGIVMLIEVARSSRELPHRTRIQADPSQVLRFACVQVPAKPANNRDGRPDTIRLLLEAMAFVREQHIFNRNAALL